MKLSINGKDRWLKNTAQLLAKKSNTLTIKENKQIEAQMYAKPPEKRQKIYENEDEYADEGEEEQKESQPKKEVKKKDQGYSIPQANQFDFTYKPISSAKNKNNKIKPESVQGQFIRASLKMKKAFNAQQKATFAAIKPNLNPDKN